MIAGFQISVWPLLHISFSVLLPLILNHSTIDYHQLNLRSNCGDPSCTRTNMELNLRSNCGVPSCTRTNMEPFELAIGHFELAYAETGFGYMYRDIDADHFVHG